MCLCTWHSGEVKPGKEEFAIIPPNSGRGRITLCAQARWGSLAVEWLERLNALGLKLPPVARPVAAYVPAVSHGGVLFVSGQLPTTEGRLRYTGRLGDGVTIEDGYAAARLCVCNALAAAASAAGGPEGVGPALWVQGFVQSDPGFHDQSKVINGASELLGELFPGIGHARLAVGVPALPLDAAVEVAVMFQTAAPRL